MRTLLALLILSLSATSAQAGGTLRSKAFCSSLEALRNEALRSGQTQDVAVVKVEAWTFACRRNARVAAQVAFCDAAGKRVGLEFTHAFPWYVHDCLKRDGIDPALELADQYTGLTDRKKLRHLTATWRDGVRIDITFKPLGDFAETPEMKDYWGEYRLTITPR